MKLRNFLYLNTKVVDDYWAAIEGGIYDVESRSMANEKANSVSGKGTMGILSGTGTHSGKQTEEITRSVIISDAAKFDKIYQYLDTGEYDGLKYYEFLTDETYNPLHRDDFLEVLVTARFSKMKELSDSIKRIVELTSVIESITDQPILDKKTNEAVAGINALEQLKSGKEISCVFEFDDKKFPLVASLDDSFFRCSQENFVGQAYLLCKVMRKIPKGQSVKLDEIFDDIKKMPLNRSQRRSMPKNINNPAEIRDIVKGPALVVLPVAVYQ